VNALVERWPLFARLGRVELATLPTPVEPLPRASETLDSEIWVKRDDTTAVRYGGNKVRKLEYLLAAAKAHGANTLITAGAVGSHHVFATALYGRDHGFETYAALTPQPYTRHVEEQLRACLAVGAHLYPVRGLGEVAKRMLELRLRLRFWGRKPWVIPLGGSNVYGVLGFVNAGLELAQQIDAGMCPDFEAIYVSAGTCATVAGIALGLAAGGVQTKVIAVRVTDRLLANQVRVAQLLKETDQLLRKLEPRFPAVAERAFASITLDSREFGEGYGRSTTASDAARDLAAREGILLDETYTSKTFACMVREAGGSSDGGTRRGQKLLYWHTLSSANLEPFLREAPEAPERFVKLMTLG
jgi:1-aminocyclopropane-1-carboxylate deaminase/D-cysteine desulfhydrase-like pyridoxal-dependent ACC family enzyme